MLAWLNLDPCHNQSGSDSPSDMCVRTQVPDGLERWRLDHAMPRLLVFLKDHKTLVAVTEQVR